MIIDSEPEYAVEVAGRGFSIGTRPLLYILGDEPTYGVDLDEARAHMRSLQQHYISLGCADVALTVRIVTRTVTVTRGDWKPFVEPKMDPDTGRPIMPNRGTA